MNLLRNIATLYDGSVSILTTLPGQAVRTWPMIPPADRRALLSKIGLGGDDFLAKATPFLALGIVGLVAYNIWRKP